MSRKISHLGWTALVIGVLGPSAPQALACAVCFGDPNSAMAKGAAAGVMVLAGVISGVLACIVGTAVFWVRRSRLINRQEGVASCRTP